MAGGASCDRERPASKAAITSGAVARRVWECRPGDRATLVMLLLSDAILLFGPRAEPFFRSRPPAAKEDRRLATSPDLGPTPGTRPWRSPLRAPAAQIVLRDMLQPPTDGSCTCAARELYVSQ
jgi:hypothetical protein